MQADSASSDTGLPRRNISWARWDSISASAALMRALSCEGSCRCVVVASPGDCDEQEGSGGSGGGTAGVLVNAGDKAWLRADVVELFTWGAALGGVSADEIAKLTRNWLSAR